MNNFFPIKEAGEPLANDGRFTCPTCHHPLKHLDGRPRHKQNNKPNPTPNNHNQGPDGTHPTHPSNQQNPQGYYVMQPPVGPLYGPPPPPYPRFGFPAGPPPPGHMPIEGEEDLSLNDEEWSEVIALYMQKLNAKKRQGRKKRGRRAPKQNRMGEVEDN